MEIPSWPLVPACSIQSSLLRHWTYADQRESQWPQTPPILLLAPRPLRLSFWVVSEGLRRYAGPLPFFGFSAYLWAKARADERTRTADLISLRVCGQGLLDVAEACKSRIDNGSSVPCLARYCGALRPG